jgi:CRP-like cAMP-binding protein
MRLAERTQHLQYAPGEVIFRRGEPGNALFALCEGEVEISVTSPTGQTIVVADLSCRDEKRQVPVFGELSLFFEPGRSVRSATATAASDCRRILRLYRDDFVDLLATDPSVALDVLQALAGMVRRSNELLMDVVTLDPAGRLCKALTALMEADGVPQPDGSILIDRPLDNSDLGAMTALATVEVARLMQNLQPHTVDRQADRLFIKAPDKLAECVNRSWASA